MPDNNKIMEKVDFSTNAMLMLNSSCQGIVETYINPSSNNWYPILENELVTAQRLVREWRNSGTLYFNEDILANVIQCGKKFMEYKPQLLEEFKKLEQSPDNPVKADLIQKLNDLKSNIKQMNSSIVNYEDKLLNWGDKIDGAHQQMLKTVTQIQQQEESIQAEIQSINQTIASLQNQIKADKEAIAKAKAAEKRGKIETIFGFILAPFTGGLSLILAGIGVASIEEAKGKIAALKVSMHNYQNKIVNDQKSLDDDKKQIATLQGLTLSTNAVLEDMNMINNALDSLKILWQTYADSMQDIIKKIDKGETADDFIIGEAWFNAACNEWEAVVPVTDQLKNGPVHTTHEQLNPSKQLIS